MKTLYHLFATIFLICSMAENGNAQTIDCKTLNKAFHIQDSIVYAPSNIVCKNGDVVNDRIINILFDGEYHNDEVLEGTVRSDQINFGKLYPMYKEDIRNYPTTYTITVSGSIMPYNYGVNYIFWQIEHYSVTLWGNNKCGQPIHQVLATAERFDDAGPFSVIWSGDIDRDGQMDLIMNISDHYNRIQKSNEIILNQMLRLL